MSKRWRLPMLVLLLAGYCWLTGFSAATVRAAVMLALVNGAYATGRRPDRVVLLCAAMIAVLLSDPLQLFAAGFTLSFAAMGGILLLQPPLSRAWERLVRCAGNASPRAGVKTGFARRAMKWLCDAVTFSVAAQLGVLLPTAVYFHQLPLYGVLINCLIVPLTGVLVPVCLLALLCAPVPWLGVGVGAAARLGCAFMLGLARLVSGLPGASVRVPGVPAYIVFAAVFAAVFLSRYFRGGWRVRALALLATAVLAVAGVAWTRPPDLRYIQLDVGDADAALIVDGAATLAIDASEDGQALCDYLLAEGRDLDALVITHLHADHALGVKTLLEHGIRVKAAYLPVYAEKQLVDDALRETLVLLRCANVPVRMLAAGDELRYNKVGLRVLWPVDGRVRAGHNANDYALVTLIDFAGYRILNASDLPSGYEVYCAQPCDVLKAAHHGSISSTGDGFLSALSPRLALISCREGNATPSEETLARLSAHGVRTLRTDETGDITLTVEGGRLIVSTYKQQGRADE